VSTAILNKNPLKTAAKIYSGGRNAVLGRTFVPSSSSPITLFQEAFVDGNFSARGWYGDTSHTWDAAAPSGGSGSVKYTWGIGDTTPSGKTAMWYNWPTASNSVYVECYMAFSANYVGSAQTYQPHIINVLSDVDGAFAGSGSFTGPSDAFLNIMIEHNFQSGLLLVQKFQDNQYIDKNHIGSNIGENRATCGANGQQGYADSWDLFQSVGNFSQDWYNTRNLMGASTVMAAGDTSWHKYGVEVILNSISNGSGSLDGICRVYWDDVLQYERTNLIFRTGTRPNLKLNKILIAPFMSDPSTAAQSMWISGLTVKTSR
jgi:hypothetical protein